MDINQIKKQEMGEIIDFYYHIEEFGYIYHPNYEKELDASFKKILEGIKEVRKIMDNSYGY
jgi:hypothetical protein